MMRLNSAVGIFALGLQPTKLLSSSVHPADCSESLTVYPDFNPSGLQHNTVKKTWTHDVYETDLTNNRMSMRRFKKGQRKRHHTREHQKQQEQEKDCDPFSEEADLGILSCGYQEYCVVNEASALGGRCVEASVLNHRQMDNVRRAQEEGSSNLFEYAISQVCYNSNNTYCTCSNMNETEKTGVVSCHYYNDFCYRFATSCATNYTACVTSKSETTFTEVGAYDEKSCWYYSQPKAFKMCFSGSFVNYTAQEECSVTIDDVECTSCVVVPTPIEFCYEDGSCSNQTAFCYHFDCSSIDGGWAGVDCFMFYDYGCDVVECSICGEGEEISLPEETFQINKSSAFPNKSSSLVIDARCGDTYWLTSVSTEKCQEIQSFAYEVCGCIGGEEIQGPSTNGANSTQTPSTDSKSGSSQHLSIGRGVLVTGFLMSLIGSAGAFIGW